MLFVCVANCQGTTISRFLLLDFQTSAAVFLRGSGGSQLDGPCARFYVRAMEPDLLKRLSLKRGKKRYFPKKDLGT